MIRWSGWRKDWPALWSEPSHLAKHEWINKVSCCFNDRSWSSIFGVEEGQDTDVSLIEKGRPFRNAKLCHCGRRLLRPPVVAAGVGKRTIYLPCIEYHNSDISKS